VGDYSRLWQTIADYSRLQQTTADYSRLWKATGDCSRLQTNSIALLQYYAEGKVTIGTMGTMDHYGVYVVLLQGAADGPGFADVGLDVPMG
jgi:hypothetical protein